MQRKTKDIYDLTKKLGCIELENKELKLQVDEKNELYESRLDSSRIIVE